MDKTHSQYFNLRADFSHQPSAKIFYRLWQRSILDFVRTRLFCSLSRQEQHWRGENRLVARFLRLVAVVEHVGDEDIHAGGLRYHAMAPLICQLHEAGLIEAKAYHQITCFDAAVQFARSEGIIPAPETSHAIRAAIDEALEAKEAGASRVAVERRA